MLSITIYLYSNIISISFCIQISCLNSSAYSQINWQINNIKSIIFTYL